MTKYTSKRDQLAMQVFLTHGFGEHILEFGGKEMIFEVKQGKTIDDVVHIWINIGTPKQGYVADVSLAVSITGGGGIIDGVAKMLDELNKPY